MIAKHSLQVFFITVPTNRDVGEHDHDLVATFFESARRKRTHEVKATVIASPTGSTHRCLNRLGGTCIWRQDVDRFLRAEMILTLLQHAMVGDPTSPCAVTRSWNLRPVPSSDFSTPWSGVVPVHRDHPAQRRKPDALPCSHLGERSPKSLPA